LQAELVQEAHYTTWLTNIVIVKKPKWKMEDVAVSHQIKTLKMQYMKVNQVISQQPIFSSKASISRFKHNTITQRRVWQIYGC